MRKIWIVLLLTAAVLMGCAPAATAAPEPTTAEMATDSPTAEATSAKASDTPALKQPTLAEAEAGVVTYAIVPEESKVTYTVGETFINQNNRFAVAVGTTGQVSGTVTADPSDPTTAQIGPIEVDISQFESDSSRRDQTIRNQWLESARFPIATFVPTKIEGLPEQYTDGSDTTLTVTGDLTVHEVTREVVFEVTTRLTGDTLTGTATTTLLMSDFGVGPISIMGMLNTEDEVSLSFDFVARPQ